MSVRTDQQNKALHLWFRLLAEALNEKHYDFRDLRIEIQPTEYLVKKYMWKPVQEEMYGNKSTKLLEIDQVSVLYDILNKALGERLGVHVPFPTEEDVQHAMRNQKKTTQTKG